MTKKIYCTFRTTALLFFMVAIVCSLHAQTAIERLKKEYPAVMEQYGKRLEALKADYIIAIDVSGTMNNYKETVVPALQEFLGSIPDGDYVCILKFGTVTKEAGLSGQINSGNRASFRETLEKIYERDPDCYSFTDICKMLESVNERMNRPGHNELQYVFMFTDFVEDASTSSADWEALATKMKATTQRNMVLPFAMQLNGKGAGQDIPKVRRALPNLRIININSSSELNAWFEDQKADISKSRLKDLILSDFDKWYSEKKITTELAIGINRGLKLKYQVDGDVVPAFVNGFMLTKCEPVSQSNNVEKIVIKHDTIYKGRDVSAKIGSLKFFKNPLLQKKTNATVAVTMRPTFVTGDKEGEPSFANEIRNLGLENYLMRTTELTAESSFVLGWNIWLVATLLMLLLVFLYYFVKMTVLPYKLNNVKVVATTTSDGQTYTHQFIKEKSFLFGTKGVVLPQANFVLKVHGRRGFPILVPRSIAFSIVEKPQNVQLSFFKNNANVPSLSSTVKVDDTIRIQQGGVSYVFKLR